MYSNKEMINTKECGNKKWKNESSNGSVARYQPICWISAALSQPSALHSVRIVICVVVVLLSSLLVALAPSVRVCVCVSILAALCASQAAGTTAWFLAGGLQLPEAQWKWWMLKKERERGREGGEREAQTAKGTLEESNRNEKRRQTWFHSESLSSSADL